MVNIISLVIGQKLYLHMFTSTNICEKRNEKYYIITEKEDDNYYYWERGWQILLLRKEWKYYIITEKENNKYYIITD